MCEKIKKRVKLNKAMITHISPVFFHINNAICDWSAIFQREKKKKKQTPRKKEIKAVMQTPTDYHSLTLSTVFIQ